MNVSVELKENVWAVLIKHYICSMYFCTVNNNINLIFKDVFITQVKRSL